MRLPQTGRRFGYGAGQRREATLKPGCRSMKTPPCSVDSLSGATKTPINDSWPCCVIRPSQTSARGLSLSLSLNTMKLLSRLAGAILPQEKSHELSLSSELVRRLFKGINIV